MSAKTQRKKRHIFVKSNVEPLLPLRKLRRLKKKGKWTGKVVQKGIVLIGIGNQSFEI